MRIFDEEAQAMQSVRNSSRMLQESFATGTAILAKYAEQRERLKVLSFISCAYSHALTYACVNKVNHMENVISEIYAPASILFF